MNTKKFGRPRTVPVPPPGSFLQVIEPADERNWLVRCLAPVEGCPGSVCGVEKVVRRDNITSGRQTSCGCRQNVRDFAAMGRKERKT